MRDAPNPAPPAALQLARLQGRHQIGQGGAGEIAEQRRFRRLESGAQEARQPLPHWAGLVGAAMDAQHPFPLGMDRAPDVAEADAVRGTGEAGTARPALHRDQARPRQKAGQAADHHGIGADAPGEPGTRGLLGRPAGNQGQDVQRNGEACCDHLDDQTPCDGMSVRE